jgi:hypothetical protein
MPTHPVLITRFPLSHVANCQQIPYVLRGQNVVCGIASEPSYSLVVDRDGLSTEFAKRSAAAADTLAGRGTTATCGLPGVVAH